MRLYAAQLKYRSSLKRENQMVASDANCRSIRYLGTSSTHHLFDRPNPTEASPCKSCDYEGQLKSILFFSTHPGALPFLRALIRVA